MKKPALSLFFCLSLLTAVGQDARLRESNRLGWFVYNGDHQLSKRWELHTEYQWRRVNFLRHWQQSLARLGAAYQLSDQVKLAGGYTFFTTYPYGRYPVADLGIPYPEHRIYQDFQLEDSLGRLAFSHRFRLEQRWLANLNPDSPREIESWDFQNRIRYQLQATLPLRGQTLDDGEPYLVFFDELFIGFGKNVGQNVFNQNRISGGIGYQFNKAFKLELAYLNQILQHPDVDDASGKPVFELNHGFRLNLVYDLDFTKN